MTYEETETFIHRTNWKGSRLGLERMNELMHRLGDPQDRLRFVHVAGTNGKGSTCTLIASMLTAAGYRTGLYTSPHLLRVNERMRIDGRDISDGDLIAAAERVKAVCDVMEDEPTEFEIITAMAFCAFETLKCDIVVLEVGLGGRLDATNVIPAPLCAVITNLGLEHTEILGDTIEKIAWEKAGILKTGTVCAAYRSEPAAVGVLEDVCRERNIPLHVARFEDITVREQSLAGQVFDWREWKDIRIALLGDHQLRNTVTAMEAVLLLRERGLNIPDEAVYRGLADARWEARFEILSSCPLFIADGAHNPQCVDALSAALSRFLPGQRIPLLVGVLADKDYKGMLHTLMPHASSFICVTPPSPRALASEDLAAWLRTEECEAEAFESIEEGLLAVLERADFAPAAACGSLYMMGDIRALFPRVRKKFLRRRGMRARRGLSDAERAAANHALCERIASSEEYKNARTLMAYVSVRGEADLSELCRRAEQDGKRVVYPLCVSPTEMIALHPQGEDSWKDGAFHIPEPVPELSEEIPPEEIDLVLCPCTAFDEHACRLGMGAGYYDRFLPRCTKAAVTAAAFEIQGVADLEPEAWDVPMEVVFTERRTLKSE